MGFSAPFVSGCTALRKKETVKINMVYTLEQATITTCLLASDIYNYLQVMSAAKLTVCLITIVLCILSPNNVHVFALF